MTSDDESTATIRVRANGPYVVRGTFVLCDAEGHEVDVERRNGTIALCRCGASQNKPFCDKSHVAIGFEDPGTIAPMPPGRDSKH